MSWQDAHSYNAALRRVEDDLNTTADGRLIWRPEYAQVFDCPERLLEALRSRWLTMVQAQIGDALVVNGRHSDEMMTLAAAHPGLVRALAHAGAIYWIDSELRTLDAVAA